VDRVALVTGASSGIGKACAARLHAGAWKVVGASRHGTSAGGCQGIIMDVDDDSSVAAGMATVLRDHGRIDAVVTCAGYGLAGAVEMTPISIAKQQLETNFWGTARVLQAALPALRASQDGRAVLMSSIGGLIGIPFQAYYSASKFALEGFAEALAYEVSPLGVRITLVEPGNVLTEFTERRQTLGNERPDDPYTRFAQKALGRMERDERNGIQPERVAAMVERVLSDRHPPRRISVGKLGERVGLPAKRLLPDRLFAWAARSSLGV